MRKELLPYLACPVSQSALQLQVFEEKGEEIISGVLKSEAGFVYPIVNGIPRLLIESFEDHAHFLNQNLSDFEIIRSEIRKLHPGILKYCISKNRRTKASFGFEWGLLDYDADKIWHESRSEMMATFYQEAGMSKGDLESKIVLDAGCGHGLLSMGIASEGAKLVIGMDLGQSVDRAYEHNSSEKVHFIQADLMFPPFPIGQFDLVHSSGVIHHTVNTELSFSILHELVKISGRYCVWLYHPIPTLHHRFFTFLRPFSSKLPVRLQYILYHIFIFPWAFAVQKMKGKEVNRRELMIDLMDALSCEYRWEHTEDEAISWYARRGYKNIRISTRNWFGFSLFGDRN
jgi:2-polyprenyl-3-methyl-5-hydroxy-6-metoxy-1,4-benzoquinol methylase